MPRLFKIQPTRRSLYSYYDPSLWKASGDNQPPQDPSASAQKPRLVPVEEALDSIYQDYADCGSQHARNMVDLLRGCEFIQEHSTHDGVLGPADGDRLALAAYKVHQGMLQGFETSYLRQMVNQLVPLRVDVSRMEALAMLSRDLYQDVLEKIQTQIENLEVEHAVTTSQYNKIVSEMGQSILAAWTFPYDLIPNEYVERQNRPDMFDHYDDLWDGFLALGKLKDEQAKRLQSLQECSAAFCSEKGLYSQAFEEIQQRLSGDGAATPERDVDCLLQIFGILAKLEEHPLKKDDAQVVDLMLTVLAQQIHKAGLKELSQRIHLEIKDRFSHSGDKKSVSSNVTIKVGVPFLSLIGTVNRETEVAVSEMQSLWSSLLHEQSLGVQLGGFKSFKFGFDLTYGKTTSRAHESPEGYALELAQNKIRPYLKMRVPKTIAKRFKQLEDRLEDGRWMEFLEDRLAKRGLIPETAQLGVQKNEDPETVHLDESQITGSLYAKAFSLLSGRLELGQTTSTSDVRIPLVDILMQHPELLASEVLQKYRHKEVWAQVFGSLGLAKGDEDDFDNDLDHLLEGAALGRSGAPQQIRGVIEALRGGLMKLGEEFQSFCMLSYLTSAGGPPGTRESIEKSFKERGVGTSGEMLRTIMVDHCRLRHALEKIHESGVHAKEPEDQRFAKALRGIEAIYKNPDIFVEKNDREAFLFGCERTQGVTQDRTLLFSVNGLPSYVPFQCKAMINHSRVDHSGDPDFDGEYLTFLLSFGGVMDSDTLLGFLSKYQERLAEEAQKMIKESGKAELITSLAEVVPTISDMDFEARSNMMIRFIFKKTSADRFALQYARTTRTHSRDYSVELATSHASAVFDLFNRSSSRMGKTLGNNSLVHVQSKYNALEFDHESDKWEKFLNKHRTKIGEIFLHMKTPGYNANLEYLSLKDKMRQVLEEEGPDTPGLRRFQEAYRRLDRLLDQLDGAPDEGLFDEICQSLTAFFKIYYTTFYLKSLEAQVKTVV